MVFRDWTNATRGVRDADDDASGILIPDALGKRFELARYRPSSELADLVERYWRVRWELPEGERYESETLPFPCVNVVFEPGGSAVHGIPTRRFVRRLEGRGLVFAVRFRPGAFGTLTSRSAVELTDAVLPLGDVLGAGAERLECAVLACDDDADRIVRIEDFLRARWTHRDPERAWVARAVDLAREDRRIADVAELAARLDVPIRSIQRVFRQHLGVSPKWVLRRFRIQEAAERIGSGDYVALAALASELGYCDQAHLIRDFRAQVGTTPTGYAARCAAERTR